MVRIFLMALAIGLAPVGLAVAQGTDAPPEAADGADIYLLRAGDVVEISVLEDSSLNRQVLIRPDGRITLPLAGSVDAQGISPEALQEVIRTRLAEDFIEPPTVTVSLVRSAGEEVSREDVQIFYVIGQVGGPGRFEVLEPVDILQALAMAGGPGVFAATGRIQLRKRDENGGETVRLFDYERVLEGAGIELLVVEDGDVVVVPERGLFE